MYFHSIAAKSTAKSALKGQWPAAIAACAIGFLGALLKMVVLQVVSTVLQAEYLWSVGEALDFLGILHWSNAVTTVVGLALDLFWMMPLWLGILRWFWRLTGGVVDGVGEIFYYFSYGVRYRRALAYAWAIGWRLGVASLVVYLPYLFVSMVTGGYLFGASVSTALSILLPITGMFSAAGAVLYIVYQMRYFLTPWVLFSYEERSVSEVLRQGVQSSVGYKSGYVGFVCTFLFWVLSCALVLPMVYVAPWLLASVAVYGRYCINHGLQVRAEAQNWEENAPKNLF